MVETTVVEDLKASQFRSLTVIQQNNPCRRLVPSPSETMIHRFFEIEGYAIFTPNVSQISRRYPNLSFYFTLVSPYGLEIARWLKRELTDQNVGDSNAASAF
ncbi:hypothetical protein CSKR_110361 [Clonorchis sinensis]|uniref:Uncharacterized protein n=1 Tax=Clonorchis sinensis TaxID=79923 RepID=A0A419PQ92_CLOSI|nr:hypothetical protein CSKR_110361 [Clonorchis sinensis]